MGAQPVRFRDPTSAYSLFDLAEHPIDVVCQACGAHARVVADPAGERPSTRRPRRLVCAACGHTRNWSPRSGSSSWWGGAIDPFFQRPLWLTTTVRGHRLWAYHLEHLVLLERFIAAGLRERGTRRSCDPSLIERLPAWLKSARHRDDLLAATARLKARCDDPGRSVPGRRPATAETHPREYGANESLYYV